MTLFNVKKIIKHCFENLTLANKQNLGFPTKINKIVKNHQKKSKKAIFVPKITNTFNFSSPKSQKKSVVFFSDFLHGITPLPLHSTATP